MDVRVTEEKGIVIISLAGKIMGGPEAGQINDSINSLIEKGKTKIIIDLEKVDLMNSSGLGILIGAVTTLKNNNGKLCLINTSDRIRNLLRITKLERVFEIKPDLEAALSIMQ
ncbi:MAG: STAS domain-containing protein [Calditrichaceae bacterium]|mgnify:CR=1 FL=1|nr:STAS domain-containing protein [Calditrichaceae bacterium]MBN2708818.1 STAS domain-containing protein [Calditrichaceae bacterium]RQV97653.1 MAG: anti-sigma factor antagonist [Calditrichota bacterium]